MTVAWMGARALVVPSALYLYNWEVDYGKRKSQRPRICLWAHQRSPGRQARAGKPVSTCAPSAVLILLKVAALWRDDANEANDALLPERIKAEKLQEQIERMKERIIDATDHECDR